MSEPLPPNPYSDNSVLPGAYDCCLYVQGLSDWGVLGLSDAAMLQTAPQVAGRTLGYALIAAPTDKARHCVAREVFRFWPRPRGPSWSCPSVYSRLHMRL